MTDYIGKKITVSIGGQPPVRNPNEIIGSETTVHINDEDLKKYDRIVGEEVVLTVSTNIDNEVNKILSIVKNTNSNKKEEIIRYCENILSEKNEHSKLSWIPKLISISSDVAQISSLVLQLSAFLPK